MRNSKEDNTSMLDWDHSTDPEVHSYYEQCHDSPAARARFMPVLERVLEVRRRENLTTENLNVLDIGCGPGAQCLLWADSGHCVSGLDISEDFVRLAENRLQQRGFRGDFRTGTATALPFDSGSKDVALLPELLEHVADWTAVLNETTRVLRPGGVLFLSTTNVVCPSQNEFDLPLYSWYPAFIKRHVVRLSVTTHPQLANHARYPAVNWFSYRSLERHLTKIGYRCYSRFDLSRISGRGLILDSVLTLARTTGALQFVGQLVTPSTTFFAVKLP
jgi:2-polyprenyl-6-hydroxyphenyl methylase/3-demethylubiquinone-9 3-methyltransferase